MISSHLRVRLKKRVKKVKKKKTNLRWRVAQGEDLSMDGFAACRRILWFYLGLFDGREPSMSNQLADKRQTRRTGRARRSGNRERVERVLRLLPSQLTE